MTPIDVQFMKRWVRRIVITLGFVCFFVVMMSQRNEIRDTHALVDVVMVDSSKRIGENQGNTMENKVAIQLLEARVRALEEAGQWQFTGGMQNGSY